MTITHLVLESHLKGTQMRVGYVFFIFSVISKRYLLKRRATAERKIVVSYKTSRKRILRSNEWPVVN